MDHILQFLRVKNNLFLLFTIKSNAAGFSFSVTHILLFSFK